MPQALNVRAARPVTCPHCCALVPFARRWSRHASTCTESAADAATLRGSSSPYSASLFRRCEGSASHQRRSSGLGVTPDDCTWASSLILRSIAADARLSVSPRTRRRISKWS